MDDGTNESLTKSLVFQVLFLYTFYRLRALKTLYFYVCIFIKKNEKDFWWRWVLWTMTRRTLKQPGQKNLNSTPSSSSFKDVKSKQGRPITFMAHIGLVCHKSLYYSMVSREFKIFCIEKMSRNIMNSWNEASMSPEFEMGRSYELFIPFFVFCFG